MEKVIEISGCSGFSGEHKKVVNFSSSTFSGNPFLKKISFMLGISERKSSWVEQEYRE
jgi:hypothetical protein